MAVMFLYDIADHIANKFQRDLIVLRAPISYTLFVQIEEVSYLFKGKS